MGPMNATVLLAVVRRERLGRLYRVQPPDEAERLRIRKLTHAFYCRDRCSVRQTQRALAEHAARRATGTIWRDLSLFTCNLAGYPGERPPGD